LLTLSPRSPPAPPPPIFFISLSFFFRSLPVTLQILPPLRLNLLVPNRSPSSSSSSNPSQLNPKTNTVTITDLVHLASLLELEVKDVILKKLAGIAKEDVETKGATEGFVDRLQGVALLQWEKGEVYVSMSSLTPLQRAFLLLLLSIPPSS